jgi:hypothetical protein
MTSSMRTRRGKIGQIAVIDCRAVPPPVEFIPHSGILA